MSTELDTHEESVAPPAMANADLSNARRECTVSRLSFTKPVARFAALFATLISKWFLQMVEQYRTFPPLTAASAHFAEIEAVSVAKRFRVGRLIRSGHQLRALTLNHLNRAPAQAIDGERK
ncbi:MAG TPA: hypothetical protein VM662_00795 [Sphingomonas sp.]|nr:hypothetical protein [Sphingomonas sp.]